MTRKISNALTGEAVAPVEAAKPAVPVTKSVFPDYIVCLEDGKQMTMLKRHLMTEHNMTVDQYRAKWGLPSSYPMVAPNYAAARSQLAKQMGLGQQRRRRRDIAVGEPKCERVENQVDRTRRLS